MSAPQLPQNDSNQDERAQAMAKARRHYQYNYSYINGVPMVNEVPDDDEPSLLWLIAVARSGLVLLENSFKIDLQQRQRLLQRWRRYVGRSNGRLFSASIEFWGTWGRLRKRMFKGQLTESLEALQVGGVRQFLTELFNFIQAGYERAQPRTIENYQALFTAIELPAVAADYESDRVFARYRIAGSNPMTMKRLDAAGQVEFFSKFPLSEQQYSKVMSGDNLADALAQHRLYVLDFALFEGVAGGTFPNTRKYLAAPIALFAVPAETEDDRDLRAVAIQCAQLPGPEVPIIQPGDGAWAWAKQVVQVADANHHEALAHLAYTHLVLSPFVLASNRRLAPNHPVLILLKPHFEGTLSINDLAQKILVAPGGTVDALLATPIDVAHKLIADQLAVYDFDAHRFPQEIANRGLDDEQALPDCPYRDDGQLLWQAVHDWVAAYLQIYYHGDADVQADTELQSWLTELLSSNGGRMTGIGESGAMQTLAYLTDVLAQVIFTASCQHAAVNFPQSPLMSYTPSMPLAGYSEPPTHVDAGAEELMRYMPPMDQAERAVDTLYLLGSVHYTELGQYDSDQFNDERVAPVLRSFQNRLSQIEREISQRNVNRSPSYDFLKPSQVPQSINI